MARQRTLRGWLGFALIFAAGARRARDRRCGSISTPVSGGRSRRIFTARTSPTGGGARSGTLVRWGGNRTSTYNWAINASNAGAEGDYQNDGYLESERRARRARPPAGERGFAAGASVLVTVPILGHVAQDKRADGDVAKTSDYLLSAFVHR